MGKNYNMQMGSLTLGQHATITIQVYLIELSPASATRNWAICSVCGVVTSGVVLCYAAWDGTMRHCKVVPHWTPYSCLLEQVMAKTKQVETKWRTCYSSK